MLGQNTNRIIAVSFPSFLFPLVDSTFNILKTVKTDSAIKAMGVINILIALVFTSVAVGESEGILNNCNSKEKCSECIQELECVWCINPVS